MRQVAVLRAVVHWAEMAGVVHEGTAVEQVTPASIPDDLLDRLFRVLCTKPLPRGGLVMYRTVADGAGGGPPAGGGDGGGGAEAAAARVSRGMARYSAWGGGSTLFRTGSIMAGAGWGREEGAAAKSEQEWAAGGPDDEAGAQREGSEASGGEEGGAVRWHASNPLVRPGSAVPARALSAVEQPTAPAVVRPVPPKGPALVAPGEEVGPPPRPLGEWRAGMDVEEGGLPGMAGGPGAAAVGSGSPAERVSPASGDDSGTGGGGGSGGSGGSGRARGEAVSEGCTGPGDAVVLLAGGGGSRGQGGGPPRRNAWAVAEAACLPGDMHLAPDGGLAPRRGQSLAQQQQQGEPAGGGGAGTGAHWWRAKEKALAAGGGAPAGSRRAGSRVGSVAVLMLQRSLSPGRSLMGADLEEVHLLPRSFKLSQARPHLSPLAARLAPPACVHACGLRCWRACAGVWKIDGG